MITGQLIVNKLHHAELVSYIVHPKSTASGFCFSINCDGYIVAIMFS